MKVKTGNISINRYPGIQPFTREYQGVFFGRNKDIESIKKILNVTELLVLHGKSGLGKSSLINAGIIPIMEKDDGYKPLLLRFGAFNRESPSTPKEIFIKGLKNLTESKNAFLSPVKTVEESIWSCFKKLQWNWGQDKGILLVLDQFEEIFTYPNGLAEFFQDFSELIFNRMPDTYRRELYQWVKENPDEADKYSAQIDFIDKSPVLKLLIGIRSDKLSLLDRLSQFIPNVLKNTYEIKPLSIENALEAIIKPAEESKQKKQFISPPFKYDVSSLDHIISYLSNQHTLEIEPFLLQIVCQYIEKMVLLKYPRDFQNKITVTKNWIENLDTVTKQYYINVITERDFGGGAENFTLFQQLLMRYFIERNLIDNYNNHRISLDGAIVRKNIIDESLLEHLVNSRIIRREPNTVSGVSYEISHDTLIEPILKCSEEMGDLEIALDQYFNIAINNASNKDKFQIQQIIDARLINSSGQVVPININSISEDILNFFVSKNLVRLALGKDNEKKLELVPMFLNPSLRIRGDKGEKQREKYKQLRWVSIIIGVMGFIAISSAIFSFRQYKLAEDAREAAKNAQIKAEESSHKADSTATLATNLKEEAVNAANLAIKEKERAQEAETRTKFAMTVVDSLRLISVQEAKNALYAKENEIRSRKNVELQKELVTQAKDLADQKSQLEVAKSLALQSSFLLDTDPVVSFRLAEAAYKYNQSDFLIQKSILNSFYKLGLILPIELDENKLDYPLTQNSNRYTFNKAGDRLVLLYDPEGMELFRFTFPKKVQEVFVTLDNSYLVVKSVENNLLGFPIKPEELINFANKNQISQLSEAQKIKYGIKR